MKKSIYTIFLFPLVTIAQTQIGPDINGEFANDYSGNSVALSYDGNTLAVGALFNSDYTGHVRILKKNSGVWTQIGSDINGEAILDQSGISVALSADGTIVAIGSRDNDGNGDDSGHVRVYKETAGVWNQLGIDIDGENTLDQSGTSVALSADGTILAVGAPYNDGTATDSGHVRLYKYNLGTWTQIGSDINGEASNDNSGNSVALSADGNIVAISAIFNDGNGNNSGHVRVYQNIAGNWTQIGSDINGENAEDRSGHKIALSSNGAILAIGAIGNDATASNAGHVRVYQNIANNWVQLGNDIDGEASDDFSGFSVALSADGTVLAIGALYNDGNGADSGHTRIYKNVANTWTQMGTDINGEALNDSSGYSVALSGDGNTVAIGAPLNDGNGSNSGHVRVFDLTTLLTSDNFVLDNTKIYPNPTTDKINIQVSANLKLHKITIYNTLGQIILVKNDNSINLSTFSKGTYYLEIITDKGKATQTLILQ